MPYQGEFAEYKSIRRLVENEKVKGLLGRAKERDTSQDSIPLSTLSYSDIEPSKWQPELVLAIDGSHQPVLVEKGFPGSEVGYVTVAAVLMDVAKIRELDKKRPVDPKAFRATENATSVDRAFPGCNIIIDDEQSSDASLRKALFETFNETRLFSDGETLLETYEALLGYKNQDDVKQNCPYGDNCLSVDSKYKINNGMYKCHCVKQGTLYSTDALRIHEGMVPDSTNGAMFAEIMQTIERVLVVHVLRWFERKNLLYLLTDIALVVDGPLALFGHPAGLLLPIIREIRRINEEAKKKTDGVSILLVGIEKTGFFVNHFERIDQNKNGTSGLFVPQTVALLSDEYIKKNIVFSDSMKPYGQETYFGRKFFYKTKSGARIVASLPMLDVAHEDQKRAEPDQYPRLADTLALFDQVASSRFPNALSPLISANAEAAIPMNLGSRVLEEMTKRLIKERKK
ncbi:MAG: DNA double-strand break repair nuclease NurA [Anaerolineales bacterium]|nr:DNA double-strand break repair nuclease NurA [Anaerolineales bacterium]